VELEVTRMRADARLPTRAHEGDAGLDLYAAEATRLEPGERASVGTGIAVAIPAGHAGLVLPRSGLAKRHGVTLPNAPGLVDSGYRGELQVLLLNADRTEAFEVAAGDRIAQLLVTPFADTVPVEAPSLDETSRGLAGFGSSGR
jgi:dUTP pyrophosphatase